MSGKLLVRFYIASAALVLFISIVLMPGKDPLHARVGQPLEGAFELRVGLGELELEQVQVAPRRIEMESIDPVVISSERDLEYRLRARKAELILDVEQPEVVIRDTSAGLLEVRIRLIDLLLRDHHDFVPSCPSARDDHDRDRSERCSTLSLGCHRILRFRTFVRLLR